MAKASTTKALIDRVHAEKQANVRLTCEIFDLCKKVADQALAEGDEVKRWAAHDAAWRARRAFDKTVSNLDLMAARLEAGA